MKRQLHSKEAAIALLKDGHLKLIEQCIRLGWQDWIELRNATPHGRFLSPTARAVIVYDLIVRRAQGVFANKPGVAVSSDREFLTVTFRNLLVVRFKKLNGSLEWSGIPTRQQQLFKRQQVIEGLPPQATKLVAGYVLDPTGTEIQRIVLTCGDASGLIWSHGLDEAMIDGSVVPIQAGRPARAIQQRLRSTIRTEVKEASQNEGAHAGDRDVDGTGSESDTDPSSA